MILRNQRVQPTDTDPQPKWFNSPVICHNGNLTHIRNHIPSLSGAGLAWLKRIISFPGRIDD